MARKSLDDFPETFVSNSETTNLASKAVRAGKLRKLASRLYSRDLKSPPETIVRQNLWPIIAGYFPDALIADRTALEGAPAKDGSVFLVSQNGQSDVVLPGFTLRPRRGAPASAADLPFMGALRLVSDTAGMANLSSSFSEFERLLKRRHAEIMQARPEKGPGQYKTEPNRAGATMFVAPDLVRGTLDQGFKAYRSLSTPFQRAVFMAFLISEVHPFADGNGRISRIMMNAELVAAGEQRIIIPTIYRENYLSALRSISNRNSAEPIIRTLDFAQRFSLAITWTKFKSAEADLKSANAFMASNEAEDRGIRLRLPQGGA